MSKFRQLNAHFLCLLQNFKNKQKALNLSEKNYYFLCSLEYLNVQSVTAKFSF